MTYEKKLGDHIMPAWTGAVAGIYGSGLFRAFFLIRKH